MPDTPDAHDVVAALQEANGRLRAENAELKAQLAEQAEKIARLERLISRNSGNSSMPPSTDDQPGKKPPERVSARRCCRRWRMPSRQTTAQQTTGRRAWTCLNDPVPPAGRVPALEVH